jgi:hypothetical protein
MAFVAACICGIFCLPSLSTNSGTLSVSMIGLLHHWVHRSRSGRYCPISPFCFLVVFVWGTRGCSSGSKASLLWCWSSWLCCVAILDVLGLCSYLVSVATFSCGGCLPVLDVCCWDSSLWLAKVMLALLSWVYCCLLIHAISSSFDPLWLLELFVVLDCLLLLAYDRLACGLFEGSLSGFSGLALLP